MCGLTGFLLADQRQYGQRDAIVRKMASTLSHRGPDDSGVWIDDRVALAHRRLSILDLSPAGHQPMRSSSGRYVIVFNGEIYNHLELRKELEASDYVSGWHGHSDTETLLAAISAWGLVSALKKCVGMFAFALWDTHAHELVLARDRLGEKPLYYGWQGDVFLFGSELKALRASPWFEGKIDRNALTLFLRHNYIPAPYSIYEGVSKLLPGTYLALREGRREPSITPYWSAADVAKHGMDAPFDGTDNEAIEELDRLLKRSVAGQMVADVPLGAFLSGGIDSSAVVALMQVQSSRPIKTFTIGFPEIGYNEAGYAKAIAEHLGTEHSELYVSPQDAMEVIPRLPTIYDEPFADSSQIPTHLVAALTRRHVTVALSGDGGDELFGGYNRYFLAMRIWRALERLPGFARTAFARLLTAFKPSAWDRLFQTFAVAVPARLRYANAGDRLHKLAEFLPVKDVGEVYFDLVSHWKRPEEVVLCGHEPPTALTQPSRRPQFSDFEQCMMYLDLVTYLPDDILAKVDRASMSVSLEARVPMLDHRVVEFAWTLPLSMKIRAGEGKWLLRQVLYNYVPRELIERPKMGFGVPIDTWLRGPLREWAEDLLSEERLKNDGFFNPGPIRTKWFEHVSGKRNWQYYLWDILMFQAWFSATCANTYSPASETLVH